ncbi:hypothetical protein SAMN02799620_03169 [Mycolicibacterium fluoranthenivorans]|uniref:Uncharacterized protein n=1 Tax=Mycolicibacterium fluoranthenivorans TaxID=258505 RepID=A0A1G4WFN4_9MYCO|nr:hypothetical protein [Mycobacterium hackensackense]MCV7252850.1 hypothetical protein [Mycobacterium hackensackense]SCX22044.1 hypothetical protein SAMN02799620_03169 [Mycolicibacterium fluoranthenivorans]
MPVRATKFVDTVVKYPCARLVSDSVPALVGAGPAELRKLPPLPPAPGEAGKAGSQLIQKFSAGT